MSILALIYALSIFDFLPYFVQLANAEIKSSSLKLFLTSNYLSNVTLRVTMINFLYKSLKRSTSSQLFKAFQSQTTQVIIITYEQLPTFCTGTLVDSCKLLCVRLA